MINAGVLASQVRRAAGGTDPLFANVQLLMHMDGLNGSTTFVDSSASPKTLTANAGGVIGTDKSVFGGASGRFTATNDSRVDVAATDSLKLVGEFCVEFRLLMNELSNSFQFVSNASSAYLWVRSNSTSIRAYFAGTETVSVPYTPGVWQAIAITRDASNNVRFFVDGVQQGASFTKTANQTTAPNLQIGSAPAVAGAGAGGRCYIDELRITIGSARYTSDYTPAAGPFPNSGP